MDHEGDGRTRDEALGPPRARMFAQYAIGEAPPDAHPKVPLRAMASILRLMALGLLARRHRPSPFFDASTGAPVVDPRVLTREERDRLRL